MFFRLIKMFFSTKIDKIAIFFIIIFAFKCGMNLDIAVGAGMSLSEFMLFCLTDHYYSVYAWLFFLIIWTVRQIRNNTILIKFRYTGYKQIYVNQICKISIKLLVIVLSLILVAFMVGLPVLRFTSGFHLGSEYILSSELDVLSYYMNNFGSDILSLIASVLYMWFGSVVIYCVLFFTHEAFSKKGVICSVLLIVLSTLLGFNTNIDEGVTAIFFINNWYILHHALFVARKGVIIFIVLSMTGLTFAMIIISLKKNRNNFKTAYFRNFLHVRNRACFVYITILILLKLIPMLPVGITGYDVMHGILGGLSFESFKIVDFIYYIAIPAFPLFFINASWESEKRNQQEVALIRIGSRKTWQILKTKEDIIFIFRYYILFIILSGISIMIGFIGNGSSFENLYYLENNNSLSIDNLIMVTAFTYILRIIEIILLYEIDLLAYRLTKNTVISVFVPFLLYIPGIVVKADRATLIGKGTAEYLLSLYLHGKTHMIIVMMVIYIALIILISVINRRKIVSSISISNKNNYSIAPEIVS